MRQFLPPKKAFSRKWKKSFKKEKFAKVKLFGIKNFTLFGFFSVFQLPTDIFWRRFLIPNFTATVAVSSFLVVLPSSDAMRDAKNLTM